MFFVEMCLGVSAECRVPRGGPANSLPGTRYPARGTRHPELTKPYKKQGVKTNYFQIFWLFIDFFIVSLHPYS